MITRNFNLYLTAGRTIPLVINANQYDQGEQWVFTLYNDDGTKYVPSTGGIVGIKSDNLGVINSGSVVDGNVVITETQQMTAAAGKAVFELILDNSTHGTANFILMVEPKPGDNADLSESDLSLLQEAIDATSPLPTGGTIGQVLTKTANGSTWSDAGTPTQEQVADAVSDWADEHITVETGVVIDTSLAVAGAAADSKKVGDELSDLKSAINTGLDYTKTPWYYGFNNWIDSEIKNGVISNGVISDSTKYCYSEILDANDLVVKNLSAVLQYRILYYNNNEYQAQSLWKTASERVKTSTYNQMRLLFKLSTGNDITPLYVKQNCYFSQFNNPNDKMFNYVTPQMYGAVGDGVTDDSDAFILALSSGKNVYVPSGKYSISKTLSIPDGVILYGDSIISKYTAMTAMGDKDITTGKDSVLDFHSVTNAVICGRKVQVRNIVICGNATCDYGISVDDNISEEANVVFSDLLVYNFAKIGMIIGSEALGNSRYGSQFYRVNVCYCNEYGLLCNSSDNTFQDCQFFRNRIGIRMRQSQNFLYNVLAFHNTLYEANFNNAHQTHLYSCAFDSSNIARGVFLASSEVNMINCRIRNATECGVYCDSTSKVVATDLISDFSDATILPIKSVNSNSRSLVRDIEYANVAFTGTMDNVKLFSSYSAD